MDWQGGGLESRASPEASTIGLASIIGRSDGASWLESASLPDAPIDPWSVEASL
jgi:hypothetical protein